MCVDGGMIMMLHCLETAVQYRLPVTYVVLNNSVLGNIRDFQGQDCRYCTEYQTPDLAAHAKASGFVPSGLQSRRSSQRRFARRWNAVNLHWSILSPRRGPFQADVLTGSASGRSSHAGFCREARMR